jgi:cell volume regulation protein A
MGLGAAAGYSLGRITTLAVNRIRLEYEGLYPVLTLSLVLLTYAATATIGGNGFLAVYVAGLAVGNHELIHRNSLRRFHDGRRGSCRSRCS